MVYGLPPTKSPMTQIGNLVEENSLVLGTRIAAKMGKSAVHLCLAKKYV